MAGVLVRKIVSGGQTGADRAGIDFAIAYGIEYGGWVPKGGKAEDLTTPPGLLALYPLLEEAPTTSMAARTKFNIRDSDATLIIRPHGGVMSPGTKLTIELCEQLKKPYAVIDPNDWDGADQFAEFLHFVDKSWRDNHAWLDGESESTPMDPIVLNVAGPRESKSKGIYDAAMGFLVESVGVVQYASA